MNDQDRELHDNLTYVVGQEKRLIDILSAADVTQHRNSYTCRLESTNN